MRPKCGPPGKAPDGYAWALVQIGEKLDYVLVALPPQQQQQQLQQPPQQLSQQLAQGGLTMSTIPSVPIVTGDGRRVNVAINNVLL